MDIVQNEKIFINELVAIYSEVNFLNDLNDNAKNISTKFKTLLDEKGDKYDLLSKNSVRDLKYYSLVQRVKEPDSLKEKFYRANLLQTDFKSLKFKSGPDVKRQRNEIKKVFKKCDDIIGVKILTDLNEDCKKVISILRSNEIYLREQRILLNKKDLAAQPTIMKNGLEIYKIKGEFNNDYAFELQIKSKIVSAWGEMEHSIFYKDYFISPVRETTQATMNHIGKLLFQIDDFLLSVRNANKEFKSNSEVITFLSWFDDKYSERISKKLGDVGFKIDSISEALYHINFNNNIVDRDLQFDHFKLKPTLDIYKSYVKIRNGSYDLKIFEAIVFSWFWKPVQISSSNIDSRFKEYFNLIKKFLSDGIKKIYDGLETKEINFNLSKYFNQILIFQPHAKIFLTRKEYVDHFRFMAFIKGRLEIAGIDSNSQYYSNIDFLFFTKRMEGNCDELIKSKSFTESELENYRENLSKIDSAIRLEGKNEFKKELSFINDLISQLK